MEDLHTSTGALNPAIITSFPNPVNTSTALNNNNSNGKTRKIIYKKKVLNLNKGQKKVSFRDEKGLGYGIADIYFVEKFKNDNRVDGDDGSFSCTCTIF